MDLLRLSNAKKCESFKIISNSLTMDCGIVLCEQCVFVNEAEKNCGKINLSKIDAKHPLWEESRRRKNLLHSYHYILSHPYLNFMNERCGPFLSLSEYGDLKRKGIDIKKIIENIRRDDILANKVNSILSTYHQSLSIKHTKTCGAVPQYLANCGSCGSAVCNMCAHKCNCGERKNEKFCSKCVIKCAHCNITKCKDCVIFGPCAKCGRSYCDECQD